jgi:transposase
MKTQAKQKRIEDLSLNELDMVYSLSRTGWSCPEISERYGISEADVRKAVGEYDHLRRLCLERPTEERLHQGQEQEMTARKPRKRRKDSRYVTAAERQAAYRARLKERHNIVTEEPPLSSVIHPSMPEDSDLTRNTLPSRR